MKHPLNPKKAILYIAGCETFGVKIAAESLRPDQMPQMLGLGRLLGATWKQSWLPTLSVAGISTLVHSFDHFYTRKSLEVPCIRGLPGYYQTNGRAIFQRRGADHGHLRGPATVLMPGNWKDGSDEALATLIAEE